MSRSKRGSNRQRCRQDKVAGVSPRRDVQPATTGVVESSGRRRLVSESLLIALSGVVLILVLRNAWVCDDAFIPFRTLDNLVHGYGLRWNVVERVQSFTAPLWLFFQLPFYALTREVFLTTIVLSTLLTVLAFWFGGRFLRDRHPLLVIGATLPFFFSTAFLDYGTSGLESPLTFFLTALFCLEFCRTSPSLFRLSLLFALAATNRLDLIFLLFPPFLYAVSVTSESRRVLKVAAGLSPLVLWEMFSLFYFGFPFPNTKYAKLPPNVETRWFWHSGLDYLACFIKYDLVSSLILLAALARTAAASFEWAWKRVNKQPASDIARYFFLGIGVAAYCLFVVRVGGDFMRGRFWAPPLFASGLLLWASLPTERILFSRAWQFVALAAVAFLIFRQQSQESGWYSNSYIRITDERRYFAATNTLAAYLQGKRPQDHPAAASGIELRKKGDEARDAGKGPYVYTARLGGGMLGFFAGPNVVIVDRAALTDPLLSHLEIEGRTPFRIGHMVRPLPEGYLEFRHRGSLDKMDPSLVRYYEVLHHVVSGPLLDCERLKEVVLLNMGRYDHLVREYEQRTKVKEAVGFLRR
jgi:arabinofuranosyltransferase